MKTVILKDGAGNPQGVIREIAGGQERLYDRVRERHRHLQADVEFHLRQ